MNTNTPEDAGQKPEKYEQTILDFLKKNLKDPNSMIDFSVTDPVQSSCRIGIYGSFHGWRVDTAYNAKNSYGGYVGRQTQYFWFHGEQLKGIGEQAYSCPEAVGWR